MDVNLAYFDDSFLSAIQTTNSRTRDYLRRNYDCTNIVNQLEFNTARKTYQSKIGRKSRGGRN